MDTTRASLNDEPTITLDVLEARIRTVAADLQEAQQRLAELQARGDEATFRGDENDDEEAHDLRIAAAQVKIDRLRRTLKGWQDALPEMRAATVAARAKEQMVKEHRAYMALRDTREKDVQRIEASARALVEAVDRLNARDTDVNTRFLAMLALSHRFDLEMPPVPTPDRAATDSRLLAAIASARSVKMNDHPAPPRRLRDLPFRSGVGGIDLRRALDRIKNTTAAELIEAVGWGDLDDRAAWETARDHDMRADEKRLQDGYQAARDRVDEWLRDALTAGPVPRDAVFRWAKEAGLTIHATANARGSSVPEAADRLKVISLETIDTVRQLHWFLPGLPYNEAVFRLYEGQSDRSRQMSSYFATPYL